MSLTIKCRSGASVTVAGPLDDGMGPGQVAMQVHSTLNGGQEIFATISLTPSEARTIARRLARFAEMAKPRAKRKSP